MITLSQIYDKFESVTSACSSEKCIHRPGDTCYVCMYVYTLSSKRRLRVNDLSSKTRLRVKDE